MADNGKREVNIVSETNEESQRKSTNRFEVSEGHKLHNVPKDGLSLWRAQDSVIPVQNLHVCKVCVAHTHNDDRQRLIGGSHDGFTCVCHVCHHTIRENEQNVVSLEEERNFQWILAHVNTEGRVS